ncbi:MAG: radical SAM protein [Candidatus Aenigmarchaeota archaeon]|nr:radical SAM protein [Candidatus Aenigmarchaeota archaeon]
MRKTIVDSGHYQILGRDRFEDCDKTFSIEYKEYRKKWKEYPEKRIVGEFPLHVDIESTNACNLRCVMCTRNFMTEKIGYMDWKLFKKIIDEGASHNLPSIKLNFRGEPLLHPQLPKMVKYAKSKGIIEVQFNTNGLLLTEKRSKELIEAGLDRIIFSFDGATKETYEKIRTGSNYDVVLNNIKKFIEIRDSMGLKRPCVRVQMVKMKENEHEIEEFIKMWIDVANRVAINTRREPYAKGAIAKKPLEHFPCHQIWQRMVVWWDGNVTMCCGDWHGEYILGNANESTLYELWHSEKYNHIRKLHSQRRFNDIPMCARCEVNTPRIDETVRQLVNKYKW